MTDLFNPPNFNRNIACIAEDAAIAAMLSSIVGNEGEYVSILEGPRMGRPDHQNELIRRCNSIAKLWPKMVLLSGLSQEAVAGIISFLGNSVAIRQVQTADEVLAILGPIQRNSLVGEIRCPLTEVGMGLLLAKRERKLLRIDESSPPLPRMDSTSADHIVVLDDHDSMAQVIAANYAYAIGADLILIPQREDDLREEVYAEIDARGAYRCKARGFRALNRLRTLRSLLETNLQFGPCKFVTFITRGIPYGYFYRDAPSTHLFSSPNLGEVINAGIYCATIEPFIAAAVLIDPGHFPPSETPVVSASLKSDGVCVFDILGDKANVDNTQLFFKAFPYDLLFICSHCDEVGGERLTVNIPDASGTIHTVIIDEVVQFGTTKFASNPDKMLQVHQLHRPVSIDGIDWHAAGPDLKQHYAAIWNYLQQTPPDKLNILYREKIEHVPHSTAITLKQGALMLNLQHVIDAQVSPIIFNNGCVSFYDAAHTLTFAGARAYIGTLTQVDTIMAKKVAEAVFIDSQRAESLPLALAKAQQQIFDDPDDRIYVHVGCHFTAIRPPQTSAEDIVKRRIRHAIDDRWSRLDRVDARKYENILEDIHFLLSFPP